MLRHILIVALLATPGAALARPTSTAPKPADIVANSASAPVCTHLRRKAFRPAEGWSVKTVSLVCKTVTAVLRRPGNKSFTGLQPSKTGSSK
ncbi:hypothetical protein [Methylobacterium brachiatum]|uniref:hypothetical protein n=1 Tax=Methylobacterium brachiatum TaxID=269660 RepID=UPI0013CF3DC0|nr:hypothetical protein [Methylobacterium brachiatum]